MQRIITKAAAEIRPGDDDEASPSGTFDVILSAQSLDRDGDELKSTEWQQPLPDHITFDVDHGMNVASTVGSGKPFINEDGNLQVRGAYSSIARAQEVRTLVNEGHIRTTSVAFLTHKNKKGQGSVERELLNGAFVAIPANPDAVILASKSLGERPAVERKSLLISAKGIANSVEDLKERLCDALCEAYPRDYPWIRATFIEGGGESGTVVYELDTGDTLSRSFTDDGTQAILGDDVTDVSIITTVVPEGDGNDADEAAEKSTTDADTKSADNADAAAEEAAAEQKSADDVALRARALQITFQSLGL